REFIRERCFLERHVVRVDPRASGDAGVCTPHHLAVAHDALTLRDLPECDFVSGRYRIEYGNSLTLDRDFLSGRQWNPRYRDIVRRVKMNRGILCSRELRDFEEAHRYPDSIAVASSRRSARPDGRDISRRR